MALAWNELRYSVRRLIAAPLFTFTVAATLAVSIGVNTTVFGLVNAAFLRPLAVEDSKSLVRVFFGEDSRAGEISRYGMASYPELQDLRRQTSSFAELAAYTSTEASLTGSYEERSLNVALVTGNFFNLLGVGALHGRALAPIDERGPGDAPVVVISEQLWKREFGATSRVIGRLLTISGRSFSIVGVAPSEFVGLTPERRTDAWIPYSMQREVTGELTLFEREARTLRVVGRLKRGASIASAQADVDRFAAWQVQESHGTGPRRMLTVESLDRLASPARAQRALTAMTLVWVAVLVVHLVACANIGLMFLARAQARIGETATRMALGASGARIVRLMLVESLAISVLGALGGLVMVQFARVGFARLELTSALDVGVDVRAFLFTGAFAVATALLFGLAPALLAMRTDVASLLKGASAVRDVAALGSSQRLVAIQIAVSVLLLAGAGIAIKHLHELVRVDAGYDIDHLVFVKVEHRGEAISPALYRTTYDHLVSRVRLVPGVVRVSAAENLPLAGGSMVDLIEVPGYVYGEHESKQVAFDNVAPGYFATMKIPVVAGREFLPSDRREEFDRATGPWSIVVVNQTFARRYWPGQSALGRTVLIRGRMRAQVVGVVGDAALEGLGEGDRPRYFITLAEMMQPGFELVVRTSGNPGEVIPGLRAALAELGARVSEPEIRTLVSVRNQSLLLARIARVVFSVLAGVALFLAALGVYGLTSASIAQRRQEIGVRMALGAQATEVYRLLLRSTMVLVGIGTVAGLFLCFGALSVFRATVSGPAIAPWVSLAGALLAVAVTALLATLLAARGAVRVQPSEAMRGSN